MWLQAASLGYLGIFFGISVAIGYFAGAWADRRLHTGPWLSLIGVLFGIATGFTELYRVTRQYRTAGKGPAGTGKGEEGSSS